MAIIRRSSTVDTPSAPEGATLDKLFATPAAAEEHEHRVVGDFPTPGSTPIAEHEGTGDGFLAAPALIAGEDGNQYAELLGRLRAAVAPADVIEDVLVSDIANLVWEGQRWRRLKAALLQTARPEGLARVLKPLFDGSYRARELANKWATRDSDAVAEVKSMLAAAGLTSEAIMAETLAARLDDIERLDRMIAATEARRAAALREIERRHAVLAAKLKRVAQEVEFDDTPAPTASRELLS